MVGVLLKNIQHFAIPFFLLPHSGQLSFVHSGVLCMELMYSALICVCFNRPTSYCLLVLGLFFLNLSRKVVTTSRWSVSRSPPRCTLVSSTDALRWCLTRTYIILHTWPRSGIRWILCCLVHLLMGKHGISEDFCVARYWHMAKCAMCMASVVPKILPGETWCWWLTEHEYNMQMLATSLHCH